MQSVSWHFAGKREANNANELMLCIDAKTTLNLVRPKVCLTFASGKYTKLKKIHQQDVK